ncbi:MAG TPA: glycosyltransferase [Deltaproteobacteria bacterium]|nr:glycosyltransferase [Deltaproteobacteria bacterium]
MTASTRDIQISVIIPMFNEEENAADTIKRVISVLEQDKRPFEIIPVNDGSTDNTLSVLDNIAAKTPQVRVVSYWKNGGRGKAIRYGFNASRGEYICTIDADLSYDPKYILEMTKVLDEERDIDVVLASPYMEGGATEGVPRDRLFISRAGNKILQAAMPEQIHTLTCIVRCYRKQVISSLDLESDDKEIHLEIISKILAMGYRIREIPATLTSRRKGSSKFKFRATALSHIVFTIFERPSLLFGLIGIILTLIGLGLGVYILILYYGATLNPNRPLLTLMVLFIIGGVQILSFGFLASQIHYLRKDVLLNRKAISVMESARLKHTRIGHQNDPISDNQVKHLDNQDQC